MKDIKISTHRFFITLARQHKKKMSIFASEDKAEIKDNHSRGKSNTLPSVYLSHMFLALFI